MRSRSVAHGMRVLLLALLGMSHQVVQAGGLEYSSLNGSVLVIDLGDDSQAIVDMFSDVVRVQRDGQEDLIGQLTLDDGLYQARFRLGEYDSSDTLEITMLDISNETATFETTLTVNCEVLYNEIDYVDLPDYDVSQAGSCNVVPAGARQANVFIIGVAIGGVACMFNGSACVDDVNEAADDAMDDAESDEEKACIKEKAKGDVKNCIVSCGTNTHDDDYGNCKDNKTEE